jgi:putative ribosome biogenesis GTPase RsgA
MIDPATADKFDAEVIAAFGRHLLVRDGAGRELRARPAGRRLSIVCGDRVRCAPDRAHDEVMVVEVLPRRTLLARASLRGDSEPVVANITLVVVLPRSSRLDVDRYLWCWRPSPVLAVNNPTEATNLAQVKRRRRHAAVPASATTGTAWRSRRRWRTGGVPSTIGRASSPERALPQNHATGG